jgi:filamentous hemagglutinin family protein
MATPKKILAALFLLIIFIPAREAASPPNISTEQTADNSPEPDLPAPGTEISEECGTRAGANLFYKFREFNIAPGQRIIFTAPDTVQNIIIFVSGGESMIEGKLCSAVPEADLYLLNPAGVTFRGDASLSVSGSFHVSTADYLKMGRHIRFPLDFSDAESLPTAYPWAFGFLDADIHPIFFEGNIQDDTDEKDAIAVPEGKTISAVGGDILIRKGKYSFSWKDHMFKAAVIYRNLSAPGGQIRLISVSSKGEAILNSSGVNCASFERLGAVRLYDKSVVDAGGTRPGNIFIRGDRLISNNSLVSIISRGRTTEKDIPGRIDIDVRHMELNNDTRISSFSYEHGECGRIVVKADEISLNAMSEISSSTQGSEDAGDILIRVRDTLRLSESYVISGSLGKKDNAGNSGRIEIEARKIIMTHGSMIDSTTGGPGHGGDIVIKADELLSASGRDGRIGFQSNIWVRSLSDKRNAGDAGRIKIEAGQIVLKDGALIDASAPGPAHAGSIFIRADSLTASEGGVLTFSNDGWPGKIDIETRETKLTNGARIDDGMRNILLIMLLKLIRLLFIRF